MERCVFDLEANGWRDEADTVWCIVVGNADRPQKLWEYGPDDIENALIRLNQFDEIIGHNIINYDLPLLERLYGWKPEPNVKITDTVILSRLYKSDRFVPMGCPSGQPHSLATWGYRLGKGKPSHDEWDKYSPEMLHRCSEDVQINILTYKELLRERRSRREIDWTQAENTEHNIAKIITQQEITGVPMDDGLMHTTHLSVEKQMYEIDEEIVPLIPPVPLSKSRQGTWPTKQFKKDGTPTANALRYYGDDFTKYRTDLIVKTEPINLGSPAQVKNHLLTIGWVPTEWNYKKGTSGKPLRDPMGNKIRMSPKLTLDSLESCSWPKDNQSMGDKIVKFLMLSHRKGMLEGWMRDLRPDGRLSAQAIPCGTPTGRMTHRTVVNVPRKSSPLGEELRSCFTSIPGYTRVGIDLKGCQLRGLAHYMEDEEYTDQVVNGKPHDYAAEKAGLVADDKMSAKDKGKKLNYTILFGGGDEKVATDLGMTIVESKATRKRFFDNLPALPRLLKKLKREWKDKGYIPGLDGRAIWVRSEHMLLVYLMQALESVVIKNFIIELDWRTKYRTWGHIQDHRQLITTMHDECQWLVKHDKVEMFSGQAHSAIAEVNKKFNLVCPQDIDINLGTTWSQCH